MVYEGKKFSKIVEAAYSLYTGKWNMMPTFPDGSLAFLIAVADEVMPSSSQSVVKIDNLFGGHSVEGTYEGKVEYGKLPPFMIKHKCTLYTPSRISEPLSQTIDATDIKKVEFKTELQNHYVPNSSLLSNFGEWWYRQDGSVNLDITTNKPYELVAELMFHMYGGHVSADSLVLKRRHKGDIIEEKTMGLYQPRDRFEPERESQPFILSMELTRLTHEIFGNPSEKLTVNSGDKTGDFTVIRGVIERCLEKVPASDIEKDLEAFGPQIKQFAVSNMMADLEKLHLIGINSDLLANYRKTIVREGFR